MGVFGLACLLMTVTEIFLTRAEERDPLAETIVDLVSMGILFAGMLFLAIGASSPMIRWIWLFLAPDDTIWSGNKLTPAQPFPAAVRAEACSNPCAGAWGKQGRQASTSHRQKLGCCAPLSRLRRRMLPRKERCRLSAAANGSTVAEIGALNSGCSGRALRLRMTATQRLTRIIALPRPV
jgi:hypothetical protein